MNILNQTEPCGYCGNHHHAKCPLVRAIEYFEDGRIKRVEFITPADHMPSLGPSPIDIGRTMFGIPLDPQGPVVTFTSS